MRILMIIGTLQFPYSYFTENNFAQKKPSISKIESTENKKHRKVKNKYEFPVNTKLGQVVDIKA
jgi:hypothetical protein